MQQIIVDNIGIIFIGFVSLKFRIWFFWTNLKYESKVSLAYMFLSICNILVRSFVLLLNILLCFFCGKLREVDFGNVCDFDAEKSRLSFIYFIFHNLKFGLNYYYTKSNIFKCN